MAGVGQVGPVGYDSRSIPEMVLECVEAALADAGIGYEDIAAVVTASVDLFDGLTASNIAVTEVTGAVMRPETRIAADGLCALVHGACLVGSAAYDCVLVVAHGKASMAFQADIEQWAMDPITVQALGADFDTCAALQARYLADAGAERRWAELAARRRSAAGGSAFGGALSANDVLDSPTLATPLRRGMRAPSGDGACAVVLRAAKGDGNEVVISGMGHDLEAHALGDRELSAAPGLKRACDRAYGMAGIDDPSDAFDIAEPSCMFPHEEELFIRESRVGPQTVISKTGGLFGGTAPFIGGLTRVAAATRALRAGDAKRALVHGAWGPAGQGQVVAVLESGGGDGQ